MTDSCSTCRHFEQPKADDTLGWCRLAFALNHRDAVNKPMPPHGLCHRHAAAMGTTDEQK
jgi:hypothetical protein